MVPDANVLPGSRHKTIDFFIQSNRLFYLVRNYFFRIVSTIFITCTNVCVVKNEDNGRKWYLQYRKYSCVYNMLSTENSRRSTCFRCWNENACHQYPWQSLVTDRCGVSCQRSRYTIGYWLLRIKTVINITRSFSKFLFSPHLLFAGWTNNVTLFFRRVGQFVNSF